MARRRGHRRTGAREPLAGRLRAHRERRPSRRLRRSAEPRTWASILRCLRAVRGAATDPATVDSVRRFSALGEHGALWLAIGLTGAVLDRRRRGRWARGVAAVAGTYVLNTALKFTVRRPRPQMRGPAAAHGDAYPAQLPERPRRHVVRGGARLLGPAARGAALPGSGRDGAQRASTSACTTPATSRRARCSAAPWGASRDEGRDRRDAERRQILAVQRAHQGRRPGRQLPVHDDRAERRGRARDRRAPRSGRGGRRLERGRLGHDRLPRHRGSRRRRAQGRGPRQPVPGEHPRDRRARPRRPLTPGPERHPLRRQRRPRARHRDDRDGADLRRPRGGRAAARSASYARPAAATSTRSPRRPGSRRSSRRCTPGRPRAPSRCPTTLRTPRGLLQR